MPRFAVRGQPGGAPGPEQECLRSPKGDCAGNSPNSAHARKPTHVFELYPMPTDGVIPGVESRLWGACRGPAGD